MTVESQETTIDGVRFEVAQLGVKDARALMFRLTPMLHALVSGLDLDALQAGSISGGDIAGRVIDGIGKLRVEDYEYACALLGKVSQVHHDDGRSQFLSEKVQGEIFKGRRKLELWWIAFALKVQFSDFLSGSGSA